jgi:murein DD-endopeptidase MepM/ murein hydrolase activator NlpD
VLAAALLALAGCTTPASPSTTATTSAPPPQNPDTAAALTPLAVMPLADVNPVLGADNRIHLAYELLLVNQSSSSVQLSSVATVNADHNDAIITTLQGADLDRLFRPSAGETGDGLAPGESGYLFLDATLPAGAPLPRLLRHRFALTLQTGPLPQDPGPHDNDPAPPPAKSMTFTGVPVNVSDQQAVEVAPPLQGNGWVAGNGCCDAITAHRGATLSIDGTIHVAQRFAIDFVQLGSTGQLYRGNPADNASFPFFGTQVRSAADGTVVRVLDGNPEQPPGKLPEGQTVQTADGNYIVVDIGNGRFAFYAHMQPNSLKVKVGDRVRTGDVLGLLGNTGNTDGPHLHFHIMDGPSPLLSNGLPFVFTSFTGRGVVTDEQKLNPPFPPQAPIVPVDTAKLAGPHAKQLPLNLQVVDFQ